VFIPQADGGHPDVECDLWTQDCPAGQKCMPWANDGGSSWNATKCSPVAPDPKQPGDECTVEGNGVSGVDDCDAASMCWDVDYETNMGHCEPFCIGSDDNPICLDPCRSCVIDGGGITMLCLLNCDPLIQDCLGGQGCYLLYDRYACSPDASGPDAGARGDPCEYINACDPGMMCANADAVVGCQGAIGCCTPFCEVNGPAGQCPEPDEECVPIFEPGQEPTPCVDSVGACMLPG
jgi:hypothetical protein